MENNSLYVIPQFVAQYCKGRTTEIVEYLTDEQYARLYRNPDVRLLVLESERDSKYIRCLVTRRVLPLTVMKNVMLLRAAELEFKTYNGDNPISLQEARHILIEEYPETNNTTQGNSCLLLIRRKKNQFHLPLSDTLRLKKERRLGLCIV